MIVIKRDGREVTFDIDKIYNAVRKAFVEVNRTVHIANKEEKASNIAVRLMNLYEKMNRPISVEEIQDDVETELMKCKEYLAAKAYIKYRYEHELLRNASTLDGRLLTIADNVNEEVIQENSNKNPTILSTQRDLSLIHI